MNHSAVKTAILAGILLTGATWASAAGLTLEEAVQKALKGNQGIEAARLGVQAKAEDVREARSFYLPQVSLEGGFERGDEPGFVFSRALQQGYVNPKFLLFPKLLENPPALNNVRLRLAASQLLYDGGVVRASMAMAREGQKAESAKVRGEETALAAEVAEAYLRILQLEKQREVLVRALEALSASEKMALDLQEQGMALKADVLRVQVRRAEVERDQIALENGIQVARLNLGRLMGEGSGVAEEVAAKMAGFRPLPLDSLEAYLRKAEATHPGLEALRHAVSAREQGIRREKGDYLPKVGAFAGWERNGSTDGRDANGYIVGVGVKWDLFNGAAREARLARARIERQAAESRQKEAKDSVDLLVRKAWLELDTSRRQVAVAEKAVEQAQESFRTIQDRFENGLTTVDDMLGAQAAQTRTESDHVQTLVQYAVQYVRLGQAVGDVVPFVEKIQKELMQ